MPVYEYQCEKCGKRQDKINRIEDHKNGPECCGAVMRQHFGSYHVIGDIQPYVDENIGDRPIVVKSRKHREKLMKQFGSYEKVGKGWV